MPEIAIQPDFSCDVEWINVAYMLVWRPHAQSSQMVLAAKKISDSRRVVCFGSKSLTAVGATMTLSAN